MSGHAVEMFGRQPDGTWKMVIDHPFGGAEASEAEAPPLSFQASGCGLTITDRLLTASPLLQEAEIVPIYEYRCGDCRKLTSVFVRSSGTEKAVACEKCGSTNTKKALSRFAYHRSQADILRDYGDPASEDVGEYRDPRQIGRWVENKFDEYGMELPDEARTMIEAAREGEFPEPVKDL